MDKKLCLDQELMAKNADLQARLQQAEEALYRIQDGRSDNTLWAHLVKLSSQPMAIGFPDGRLGLVNAAFEKLTGYTATELHHMNWTWAALTPPEWLNSEHEQLATLQATGVPVRYEKEYIRKDGSRVPIELLAHLMADEKGKPRFYYAFITDITERKQAEAALLENEQRMRLATEATGVGIWEWNIQTGQVRWDAQMFRIYGMTPTPDRFITYQEWLNTVLPAERELQATLLQRTVDERGRSSREFHIQRLHDGAKRCIQAVETVRTNAYGQVAWVVGSNLDITDRKRAETALREREAQLRLFITYAPANIAMFDNDMRYLAVSNHWKQDYGLSEDDDLIGRSHYQIFPEIPERWRIIHQRCLAGEVLSSQEDFFERMDGSIQWTKWEARPWRADDGTVGGILIATEEVTSQVLAKRALHESQADLNRAQAVGQLGSWRLNIVNDVLTWSDENHRIFGVTKGTPLNYALFISIVHPEDRAYVDSQWKISLRDDQEPYDIEHRIVVNGKVKWVREKADIEFDTEGKPIEGFGITQDITIRKLAELALRDTDRRKDEFLAMLAHELRNPLAPIRNAVQIIRLTGIEDTSLLRASGMIERQVNQLVRLVDDLLDVSRVSRGKITLQKKTIDLATVIRQAVETNQPLFDSRHHELEVQLPAHPVRINGDLARLAQVVSNLLNNAAKYTESGGHITLAVEQRSQEADGQEAVIRIRDNGRGIDPSALRHLFDLFYQVDRNLDRTDGGLGIGLSLVKNLVQMHGGHVEAYSAGRGTGSEFTVHLPCLPEKPPVPPRSTPDQTALTTPGHRILLVDDNLDVADSMAMLLGLYGHKVTTVHDGEKAIEVALHERPDIVLLDIGLPYMDGYQACKAMRKAGLNEALIIAMTGYGQEGYRRRAQEAGFDQYLTKPVDPQVLIKILDNVPVQ